MATENGTTRRVGPRPADVDVRRDGSERVRYDEPGRFSYVRRGELSAYPRMRASCHWHDDLEFIRVLEGRMAYFVNGATLSLSEGEGLFVNSRLLHFGYSPDGGDCRFICVLVNPMRLGTTSEIVSRYIRPLMGDDGLPFAVLSPGRPDDRAILDDLDAMDRSTGTAAMPLTRLSRFFDIVAHLHEMSSPGRNAAQGRGRPAPDGGLEALAVMVDFVHHEHQNDIRLDDIAHAAAVSRSACSDIFRRHLHQSPVDFLIDVRLQTASALLSDTSLPIGAIARRSGFRSASHFSRTFRSRLGATPTAFRTAPVAREAERPLPGG
jgi:AraC-like DNA-binding protein